MLRKKIEEALKKYDREKGRWRVFSDSDSIAELRKFWRDSLDDEDPRYYGYSSKDPLFNHPYGVYDDPIFGRTTIFTTLYAFCKILNKERPPSEKKSLSDVIFDDLRKDVGQLTLDLQKDIVERELYKELYENHPSSKSQFKDKTSREHLIQLANLNIFTKARKGVERSSYFEKNYPYLKKYGFTYENLDLLCNRDNVKIYHGILELKDKINPDNFQVVLNNSENARTVGEALYHLEESRILYDSKECERVTNDNADAINFLFKNRLLIRSNFVMVAAEDDHSSAMAMAGLMPLIHSPYTSEVLNFVNQRTHSKYNRTALSVYIAIVFPKLIEKNVPIDMQKLFFDEFVSWFGLRYPFFHMLTEQFKNLGDAQASLVDANLLNQEMFQLTMSCKSNENKTIPDLVKFFTNNPHLTLNHSRLKSIIETPLLIEDIPRFINALQYVKTRSIGGNLLTDAAVDIVINNPSIVTMLTIIQRSTLVQIIKIIRDIFTHCADADFTREVCAYADPASSQQQITQEIFDDIANRAAERALHKKSMTALYDQVLDFPLKAGPDNAYDHPMRAPVMLDIVGHYLLEKEKADELAEKNKSKSAKKSADDDKNIDRKHVKADAASEKKREPAERKSAFVPDSDVEKAMLDSAIAASQRDAMKESDIMMAAFYESQVAKLGEALDKCISRLSKEHSEDEEGKEDVHKKLNDLRRSMPSNVPNEQVKEFVVNQVKDTVNALRTQSEVFNAINNVNMQNLCQEFADDLEAKSMKISTYKADQALERKARYAALKKRDDMLEDYLNPLRPEEHEQQVEEEDDPVPLGEPPLSPPTDRAPPPYVPPHVPHSLGKMFAPPAKLPSEKLLEKFKEISVEAIDKQISPRLVLALKSGINEIKEKDVVVSDEVFKKIDAAAEELEKVCKRARCPTLLTMLQEFKKTLSESRPANGSAPKLHG